MGMGKVSDDVRQRMVVEMQNQEQSRQFITKLIVQGLLMLLENEVVIRCRDVDKNLVKACLAAADAEYSKIIKQETGATKTCKCTLDESTYLPPSCLGGVMLFCQNGKISIDNTIDVRLQLVMEQ